MSNMSIIMPVINETWSLAQVVDAVIAQNQTDIKEVVVIIHPEKTTAESLAVIDGLKLKYPGLIRIYKQDLPYIGGAMKKAFAVVEGDYAVLMASDLETDPDYVKEMFATIKKENLDIVTASRWIGEAKFINYNLIKKCLNYVFQKMFSFLYGTHLTDMTYGFRIFKTKVLKQICWESKKHGIFFESLIKPLRLGYRIKEIPTNWVARQEGETQIRTIDFLEYFIIGVKVRFSSKKSLVCADKTDS